MSKLENLENKVSLITGASGISAARAKLFTAEGVMVIGVDIDESNARRIAEEIGRLHLSQRKGKRRSYELGSEIRTIPVIPQ